MTYIITGILLYLAYRFITGFVMPVYKATSAVKKQFDFMKNQSGQQSFGDANDEKEFPPPNEKPKYDLGGEYIPFEEVKKK